MDAVNMHEAKSRLSTLVETIESGREAEVVIARNGKPAARLVPVVARDVSKRIGFGKGIFVVPDDWDQHDEAIAAMFNNGEIFPDIDP